MFPFAAVVQHEVNDLYTKALLYEQIESFPVAKKNVTLSNLEQPTDGSQSLCYRN